MAMPMIVQCALNKHVTSSVSCAGVFGNMKLLEKFVDDYIIWDCKFDYIIIYCIFTSVIRDCIFAYTIYDCIFDYKIGYCLADYIISCISWLHDFKI